MVDYKKITEETKEERNQTLLQPLLNTVPCAQNESLLTYDLINRCFQLIQWSWKKFEYTKWQIYTPFNSEGSGLKWKWGYRDFQPFRS